MGWTYADAAQKTVPDRDSGRRPEFAKHRSHDLGADVNEGQCPPPIESSHPSSRTRCASVLPVCALTPYSSPLPARCAGLSLDSPLPLSSLLLASDVVLRTCPVSRKQATPLYYLPASFVPLTPLLRLSIPYPPEFSLRPTIHFVPLLFNIQSSPSRMQHALICCGPFLTSPHLPSLTLHRLLSDVSATLSYSRLLISSPPPSDPSSVSPFYLPPLSGLLIPEFTASLRSSHRQPSSY